MNTNHISIQGPISAPLAVDSSSEKAKPSSGQLQYKSTLDGTSAPMFMDSPNTWKEAPCKDFFVFVLFNLFILYVLQYHRIIVQ